MSYNFNGLKNPAWGGVWPLPIKELKFDLTEDSESDDDMFL